MGSCAKRLRSDRFQWRNSAFLFTLLLAASHVSVVVHAALPEASSTLLKMHRYYTRHPPHDDSLYHILHVHPNATVAEIQKSYRKMTRNLHPDKRSRGSSSLSDDEREERLQQVREAYEVLKDDTTRLPYHRFGLIDTNMAAFLLTGGTIGGPVTTTSGMTTEQQRLLQWMGYGPDVGISKSHRERVMFLAANLLERIRPLVEGAIAEQTLADAIAQECDVLKRLPLGAQIIRCIGRAYRHAGQHVLRKNRQQSKFLLWRAGADLSDTMRAKMRSAKQVLTAAVASGRLVWTEKQMGQQRSQDKDDESEFPAIAYHMQDDELISEFDLDDLSSQLQTNEEIQQQERLKAQSAVLESLQVEALWKISKIDLDRTTQQACNLILNGDYFFFPFHQSPTDWDQGGDGWVGSTGEAIHVNVGRQRAAAALVMVGDIMVRCSKEGTSWRD